MWSRYPCRRCSTASQLQRNFTSSRRYISSPRESLQPCAWAANSNHRSSRTQLPSLPQISANRTISSSTQLQYELPPRELMLASDNLFHPFSKSPLPGIRRRAAFIKHHAYCPHPHHHQTRLPNHPQDLEARKPMNSGLLPRHVDFECPDCGIPVYCSEGHWAEDYEAHLQICDTLREINEDDHDWRSGRDFPEYEYPGPGIEEALINLTNWDTFFYTRQAEAVNDERSLRQVTRLLTYPVTVGSVISEFSPYNIRKGGRLTPEGLRSFSGSLPLLLNHSRVLNYGQPSDILLTLRAQVPVMILSDLSLGPLPCAFLFWERAPSRPCHAVYGFSFH